MKSTVFYSWQSDINPKINRNFIESALEKASKSMRNDVSIEASPRIDQATKNVPGAPDIFDTILEKINNCGVFVCDVSIINSGIKGRKCPNPNVLIELGYAIKTLDWERIIMVFNKAYGDPKNDSPFDIPDRRLLCYEMTEKMLDNPIEKDNERKKLESLLLNSLKLYFSKQGNIQLLSALDISEESLKPFNYKQISSSNGILYYYCLEHCKKTLNLFPMEYNIAKGGKATASSSYGERDAQAILKGNRLGIEWSLNKEKGWYEVNWSVPIKGRYLFLINRKSPPGSDPWGPASIIINGEKKAELEYQFAGSSILLIDFSRKIKIKKLHFDIEGSTYPGLSGLEIY